MEVSIGNSSNSSVSALDLYGKIKDPVQFALLVTPSNKHFVSCDLISYQLQLPVHALNKQLHVGKNTFIKR
jgi:hypothetical protein